MYHYELAPSAPLARVAWTMKRFGLTPGGVWTRLTGSDAPPVLCVCIPKAGTHLLERALCLHPAWHRRLVRTIDEANLLALGGLSLLLEKLRGGQVLMSHLQFGTERAQAIEKSGARCLFLIRDPRDIALSSATYIERNTGHPLHGLFRGKPLKERLRLVIDGYPPRQFPSMAERMQAYAGWLKAGSLVVRFEDLVGPLGGGTEIRQRQTLRDMFGYLGIDCSDELVSWVGNHVFSTVSPTFRRGRIGGWREHFDAGLETRFMEVAGSYLTLYGYSRESPIGTRAS